MDIENKLVKVIIDAVSKLDVNIDPSFVNIDHSKDPAHGDYATNIAMKLCRQLKSNPLKVAEDIVNNLDKSMFNKVEIKAPGFINFFLKNDSLSSIISTIVEKDKDFGRGENKNKRINVEFVSANPTGNLHVGHARCAAYGDSLARVLSFAGYDVTREYYVNDAGNQINHLGESIYQRYIELFGRNAVIPEDGYCGQDVIEVAKKFKEKYGDKFLNGSKEDINFLKREGLQLELNNIKIDLENFRVKFDVYSFETDIRNSGQVDNVLKELDKYIYDEEGAKILKTTAFLDDKDRPIVKGNGDYTYFLPDIAYHYNKMSRNFDVLVDVLGADHHGYINRMKSALMMKGYSADSLQVPLIQVVRLMDGDIEVKMSKRTGNAISLKELCDEVGVDAVRYFFVSRSNTSHLDFDYQLAKSKSNDNPVYYAMYAYARLCNILVLAKDITPTYDGSLLNEKIEKDILKTLEEFPSQVQMVAKTFEVHKLTIYIHLLATLIHSFYNICRVIDDKNEKLSANRLGLVKASKIVLYNALNLIGVEPKEKM